MKEMRQDRIAMDLASARTIDPHSGHMHVAQTNISKATVNPYNGDEIPFAEELGLDPNRIYHLLRDPEELKAAAASFNGKPLVMVHRSQNVTDHDHLNRVGSVAGASYEHPYLKVDLSVWDQDAIDVIQTEAQRELSCGYAYKPDMTPGTYEGKRYDGVMRSIGGNHVALVREGRAGADCHVFDSIEGLNMKTTALTRAATALQGGVAVYLMPKMAKDAKPIDFGPMLKGLTKANFKDKKAGFAADIKRQMQGKLAKDANLEDVVEVIEALAPMIEQVAEDDPASDPMMDPAPVEDGDDDDLVKKLMAKGYSEEEAKKIAARTPAPAAADEDDADKDKKKDEDKKAMDVLSLKLKDMVSKQAVDQALAANAKAVETRTVARMNGIADAKENVAPWVGKLNGAFDSAESVYRSALSALEVPDADKMHADALRPVLEAQPKPGDAQRRAPGRRLAQDEASSSSFQKRYPGAARIGHA